MQLHESILTYQTLRPVKGFWNTIRKNGAEHFKKLGMPTKNLEAWHYTSLRSIAERQLLPALDRSASQSSQSLLQKYTNEDFDTLIFVNGKFDQKLSSKKLLRQVRVSFVGDKLNRGIFSMIQKLRKRASEFEQDSMEALNSAFSDFGAVIEVMPNQVLQKPIQILNLKTISTALYPKFLIIGGRFSKFSLMECHASEFGQGISESWQNVSCEVVLGEGAHCELVRLQAESPIASHVSTSRFYLEKDSRLATLSVSLGGKLGRNNLAVHMLGPAAEAQVLGMTLTARQQHIDNKTLIDHAVGYCTTRQLYKSVLAGESRAIFCGRVHIKKDSQKANSEQLNQNLLLSEKAEANSKPELGIYADDVKASHGSAVGQVSNEEIFYLQSRAISKKEAIEMLSLGFVQELVEQVETDSIRQWLSEIVGQHYRSEL